MLLYQLEAIEYTSLQSDQMETNLHIIRQALELSIGAKTNQDVHQATRIIHQESIKKKYITSLLEIINEQTTDANIILAALAQLKNFVRKSWICDEYFGTKEEETLIDEEDRQYIIQHIYSTNEKFSENYKFAKLIKDIIQIIGKSVLFVVEDVINKILEGKQLKVCLNFILGIAGCFRFEDDIKVKNKYFKILQTLVPILTNLIHNGQKNLINIYNDLDNLYEVNAEALQIENQSVFYQEQQRFFSQIVYMSIKFIHKTISSQFPPNLRKYCCQWAIIALHTLKQINLNFSQIAAKEPEENGKRGSEMFYYFHSKKWAAKYLTKFIQKIMVYKKNDKQITHITQQFYTKNEQLLLETLQISFNHPQTKKVRFYQFEFLTKMFSLKPNIMKPWIDHYQFTVIPQYLKLSKKDFELLTEKPLDFLINQSPLRKHEYQNTKMTATKLWVSLSQSDEEKNVQNMSTIKEGNQMIKSLQMIKSYILSEDEEKLNVGLYLMIQMATKVSQQKRSTAIMKELINLLIPQIFQQENLMLQIRGYELVYSMAIYVEQQKYLGILNLILAIFQKRSHLLDLENQQFGQSHRKQNYNDRYEKFQEEKKRCQILAITAAMAFGKLLIIAPNKLRPLQPHELPIILRNITGLIQTYQLEQITETLILLVESYPEEINEYANIIICQVSRIIKEMMEKQAKGQFNYQASQVVNGYIQVLMSFSRITSYKDNNDEIRNLLEQEISSILYELYSYEAAQGFFFYQNVLNLLIRYLSDHANNPKGISQDLFFFYRLFIFKLVALNRKKLEQIEHLNISLTQKKLLFKCQEPDEFNPQLIYQIFKSYYRYMNTKGIQIIDYRHIIENIFHCSELELFFYMITFYYQKKKENMKEETYFLHNYKGRYLVTILLPCLIESQKDNLDETVYQKILKILVTNAHTPQLIKHLRKHNIQLFCAWIYGYKNALSALNEMKGRFGALFQILFLSEHTNILKQFQRNIQKKRIILGLSVLISFCNNNMQILNRLNTILYWIFYLIRQQIQIEKEDIFQNEFKESKYYHQLNEQNLSKAEEDKHSLKEQFDPNEPNTIVQYKFQSFQHQKKRQSLDTYISDGLRQCYIQQEEDDLEGNQSEVDELVFFVNELVNLRQNNHTYYINAVLTPYSYIIELLLQVLQLNEDPTYSPLLHNTPTNQFIQ